MKIAIGNDHAGVEYKNAIMKHLLDEGHEVFNVGTDTKDSVHYPEFSEKVAKLVSFGECDFGILICTTGEGISIAANKIKGVRCGIGYDNQVVQLMREHNDANVIAFGSMFMNIDDVIKRVDIFLSTKFANEGRHLIRVNQIKDLEK